METIFVLSQKTATPNNVTSIDLKTQTQNTIERPFITILKAKKWSTFKCKLGACLMNKHIFKIISIEKKLLKLIVPAANDSSDELDA